MNKTKLNPQELSVRRIEKQIAMIKNIQGGKINEENYFEGDLVATRDINFEDIGKVKSEIYLWDGNLYEIYLDNQDNDIDGEDKNIVMISQLEFIDFGDGDNSHMNEEIEYINRQLKENLSPKQKQEVDLNEYIVPINISNEFKNVNFLEAQVNIYPQD